MSDTALPHSPHGSRIVASLLLEIGAVNFRPEQPYILTSGWASPTYIDVRKLIGFPRARKKVIELGIRRIFQAVGYEAFDAVAGGETAGIPYAAWFADGMNLPMQYVRKKPKGFGRDARIEGDIHDGQRVLLVEDLTTDGASKVSFAQALRTAGACCDHAFVVFFYGAFPGAVDALRQHGINLHYLATWHDVLAVAQEKKCFSETAIDGVRHFLADPVKWSADHGGKSG